MALEEENVEYSDLVTVNKNSDGTVLYLGANTVNINKLKSAVSLWLVFFVFAEKSRVICV